MFLWLVAILSLLFALVVPDPLPLLDEATAFAIFVYAMRALGYDVVRWIPFMRRVKGGAAGARTGPPPMPRGRSGSKTAEKPDVIIDV